MKWVTERYTTIAFAMTFALLMINAGLLYQTTVELVENDQRLSRSHEILASLERTLATLNEAQASERGYLLTGETSFLEPYEQATGHIQDMMAHLKDLMSDDAEGERRVALLQRHVDVELETLSRMIQLRKDAGFEASRQRVVQGGGRKMEHVRRTAAEVAAAEREVVRGQKERAAVSTRNALLTLGLSSLLELAFLGLCFHAVRRSLRYRRAVEETLKDAGRRKDDFLATLGHELRNPLAPMLHATQLLREKEGTDPATRQVLEVLHGQVRHITRLVDDLLDVTRIDRGKIRLRREPCDLALMVSRAVEIARPLVEARRHELVVSVPGDPIWLEADPVRLVQVLANLLNNAAKYTEAGGRICLTAERKAGEALVRVRDNGVGIPADMLARVFEPFTQLESSLSAAQGGLGIGLTLARHLTALHAGSLEVFSDGPGCGSEFVVRLPALSGPPSNQVARREVPAPAQRSPGRRVLVVDDNAAAADMLAALLEIMGHEVRVARDGPAALQMTEAYRPEVVLLDIGMPGMDGHEVARHLRGRPGWEGVRLVAVTGYGQESDRSRSRESGFDGHLVKPVEPELLQELLAGPGLG